MTLAAPAALVLALGLADVAQGEGRQWWAAALLAPQALGLLWRRQAPTGVLGITLAASLLQLLSGHTSNAVVSVHIALSGVVQRQSRSRSLGLAFAVFVVLGLATYATEPLPQHVLIHAAGSLVAWWFGDAMQQERHVHETLATRVDRVLAGQQLEAQTAVAQERLRIGEELHRVVGNALAGVVARAERVRSTLAQGGSSAAEEIEAIERTGRSALDDLDRLLKLLRPVDDGGGGDAVPPLSPPSQAWAPLRSVLWTVAPTALLGPIAVLEAIAVGAARPQLRGWVLALALSLTLPLLVRRRFPIGVTVLTAGLILTSRLSIGVDLTNAVLALPVALHAVAATRPPWVSSTALVGALPPVLLVTMPRLGSDRWEFALVMVGFSAMAWRSGIAARARAVHADAVRERAEQLEREQALRVERALAADRIAMAREVHDSAGHAVSMIVLVAGAARSAMAQQPDRALDALAAIESSARSTLDDMDRIIEVFPTGSPTGEPSPRLNDLPDLASRLRAAGVETTVALEGPVEAVPPAIQASAYRIVQESLTNVLKHADARRCTVVVRANPHHLDVQIVDDGRGRTELPISSGGRGIVGMRERAEMFSGRLDTRSTGSGFTVTASFPIPLAAQVIA